MPADQWVERGEGEDYLRLEKEKQATGLQLFPYLGGDSGCGK